MRKKNVLIIFVLLGIILRLFFLLNRGEFWIDEAKSYDIAKYNVSDIAFRLNTPNELKTTIPHIQAPLYHVLLHLWMFIGLSEITFRLFSLLFGILSLFMMWKLAKDFFGEQIAVFSTFLISISPLQIYFSVDSKSYALFLFLVLCSFYYFMQFLNDSKNILLYALFTILCIYTHYYGIFLIIVENVIFFVFFLKKKKVSLTKWIISQIFIFCVFLPWINIFFKHFALRYSDFTLEPHLSSILFKGVYSIARIFTELSSFYYKSFYPQQINYYILIFFGLLFIIGLNSFRKDLNILFILCVYFFLPLIIQSYISTKDTTPYFIFLTPVFYIILSQGILFLRKKRNVLTSIIFPFVLFNIIALNGISLTNFYKEQCISDEKSGWKGLSNFISKEKRENSIVLLDRGKIMPLLNYYFKDKIDYIGFFSPKTQEALREYRNYVDECLDALSREYDYFWVIYSPFHKGRSNFTKSSLTRYLSMVNSKNFKDIKVELYKSKRTGAFAIFEKSHEIVEGEVSEFYELMGLPINIAPGEVFMKEVNILNTDSHSFYVIAKCSDVRPFYCNIALAVDDKVIDKKIIGSSFIYIYKIDAFIKKGKHRVSILFEEDKHRISQKRKLFIKNIFLYQK